MAKPLVRVRRRGNCLERDVACLAFGTGHRIVPRVDAPLGVRLRLRVPIRDVALALTPLAHTSFRNQLAASVERIDRPDSERAGEQSAVEVGLRLGEQPLRARLTRKSLDELGLEEGMPVVALVRSVAFAERLT